MSGFLGRFFRKKDEQQPTASVPAADVSHGPENAQAKTPLPPVNKAEIIADSTKPPLQPAPTQPPVSSTKKQEQDPIAMLRAIHEILDDVDEPKVTIPSDALLRRLPSNLRGPEWQADIFPPTTFKLPISSVMEQLSKGRIVFPLSEFIVDIPEGWIVPQANPDSEVELDLARVVQAMPQDSFKSTTRASAVTHELNQIKDFFGPGDAATTPSAQKSQTSDTLESTPPPALPPQPAMPPKPVQPLAPSKPAAPVGAPGKPAGILSAVRPVLEKTSRNVTIIRPLSVITPPVEVVSASQPHTEPAQPAAPESALPEPTFAPGKPTAPSVPADAPKQFVAPVEAAPDSSARTASPTRWSKAIVDEEAMIGIPCEALLMRLPQELRGPSWKEDAFPKNMLELPLASVLAQLAHGRLAYPLSTFLGDLPEEWLSPDARFDTVVELDLARVVQAIPKEQFASKSQISAVSEAMTRMRDIFAPATASIAPAPAEQPSAVKPASDAPILPEAQQAPFVASKLSERHVEPLPRPSEGPAWDGLDTRSDAGPNVVDLNRAGMEDLSRMAGVGTRLAEAILAHRRDHGPFKGIFDLAEVEGIGPKTFTMITGLSSTTRQDRHEVLNAMLGLAKEARPTLGELAQAVVSRLGIAGVVFGSLDGMVLAYAGIQADQAGIYAAVVPQMFRRTRRYLRQLLDSRVQAMAVPLSRPRLLMVDAGVLFIVIAFAEGQEFDIAAAHSLDIARELHWLLDYRAVVRPTA